MPLQIFSIAAFPLIGAVIGRAIELLAARIFRVEIPSDLYITVAGAVIGIFAAIVYIVSNPIS